MDEARPGEIDKAFREKMYRAINNDLNMPQALAVVQDLLKSNLSSDSKLATAFNFDRILGLDLHLTGKGDTLPEKVQQLVDARQKARKKKDWALSDQLRDQIQALGYVVQDGSQGMKVFKP